MIAVIQNVFSRLLPQYDVVRGLTLEEGEVVKFLIIDDLKEVQNRSFIADHPLNISYTSNHVVYHFIANSILKFYRLRLWRLGIN